MSFLLEFSFILHALALPYLCKARTAHQWREGCAYRENRSFLVCRSPVSADRAANLYFVKNTNHREGRREGQLLRMGLLQWPWRGRVLLRFSPYPLAVAPRGVGSGMDPGPGDSRLATRLL